jgi:hypothetical protein
LRLRARTLRRRGRFALEHATNSRSGQMKTGTREMLSASGQNHPPLSTSKPATL